MKKYKRPILAVDMDDTIVNLVPNWLGKYNSMTGECLQLEDIKSWDIASYSKFPKVLMSILDTQDFFYCLEPITYAIQALHNLYTYYDIIIVSSAGGQPERIKGKLEWIEKHLPFLELNKDVFFTGRKDRIKMDYLVEDGIFINNEELKCKKLLINKPWNKSYKIKNKFSDWVEVERFLLNEIKKE